MGVEGALTTMLEVFSTTTDRATQVHAGRALLNVSKSSRIQEEICKQGLYTLIEISWSPLCEESRLIVNGILNNISNNPTNRDLLYRAELHIKGAVETHVKSHFLLQELSSVPYHVQSSLKAMGERTQPPPPNRPGQRLSPLITLGKSEIKNRKKNNQIRQQYTKWIETSSIANERTVIDDIFRGVVRKAAPKYLPTLSQVDGGSNGGSSSNNSNNLISSRPNFQMQSQYYRSSDLSSTSLTSLPAHNDTHNSTTHNDTIHTDCSLLYDPSTSTASALPTIHPNSMNSTNTTTNTTNTMNNNNNNRMSNKMMDMRLDQSEIPSGLETRLLDKNMLEISGVPQLYQSMRSPMSNMYRSVPPNSSLQNVPLKKVQRDWGSEDALDHIPRNILALGDEEMSSLIEHSFWERGPMNVTSLKPSSRDILHYLKVNVTNKRMKAAEKKRDLRRNKNKNNNNNNNTTTKNKEENQDIEFLWSLQSPAYYWKSMLQETNSFGVQMQVTCQVLLDIDDLPIPPLQLPEGTKDELPPPPETPGLPKEEPKPLQVPPLGPPVPQKHTLAVDDHVCKCSQKWSLENGWKLNCTTGSQGLHSEITRYSAYEGGDCGMFGRLRDRHMQYKMTKTEIKKIQKVVKVVQKEWFIFNSRLNTSDARSYYDTNIYSKMCRSDWDRVAEQEHFLNFLKSKMKCDSDEMNTIMDEMYECFEPHYQHIMWTFEFYSAMGNSSDMSQMLYNQCMDFLGDTDIIEPKNKKMDRSVMDSIFIEANKEGEEQDESEVGDTNADRALMRFELVEMIVRIALKKYLLPGTCATLPEAVTKVIVEHVLTNDASGSCSAAIHDIDAFRKECLYCEDVDAMLRVHDKTLRAIFEKVQLIFLLLLFD